MIKDNLLENNKNGKCREETHWPETSGPLRASRCQISHPLFLQQVEPVRRDRPRRRRAGACERCGGTVKVHAEENTSLMVAVGRPSMERSGWRRFFPPEHASGTKWSEDFDRRGAASYFLGLWMKGLPLDRNEEEPLNAFLYVSPDHRVPIRWQINQWIFSYKFASPERVDER